MKKTEDLQIECPVCHSIMETKPTITPKLFFVKCHGVDPEDNKKCTYTGVYSVDTKSLRGSIASIPPRYVAPTQPRRHVQDPPRYSRSVYRGYAKSGKGRDFYP